MDTLDFRAYYNDLGSIATNAIRDSNVKKVVFLSSLGAEHPEGTGPVVGLHDVEAKLRTLKAVDIVFLRPGYFMENTLMTIPLVKSQKINGNATNPNAPIAIIAGKDIAEKTFIRTFLFRAHCR
jgi:uncharacterized protein YbjT (DUF2867 family)